MSVYTVSLRDTSNLGQVNVGDGTLLANLSVAAGRGPKGDGWTGVTYDGNTGTFIFTSNDGLAYTSPDVRPDLDNVDINSGTIDGTVIGGSTAAAGSFTTGSFTGDVSFGDNDKAIFGAGSDLQIYHNTHSYIEDAGGGDLILKASDQIKLQNGSGQNMAVFNENGAVVLTHSEDTKLATTSTGVDVTGTLTSDGLTVDADGASIAFTGTAGNNFITAKQGIKVDIDSDNNQGATSFDITHGGATGTVFSASETGDISFYEDTGTTPKFFWDASAERLGIGTTSPTGRTEIADNGLVNDRLLFLNSSGGTAGGQTGPLYGLYSDIKGNNNSTAAYGAYLTATPSGGQAYGVFAESTQPSSSRDSIAIYGNATVNSSSSNHRSNRAIGGGPVAGVYATTSTTGTNMAAQTTALHALNATVYGSEAYGAWIETTAGPTTVVPLKVAHAGSELMRIDSGGHAIIPAGVTLGTSAGVYNAANTLNDYEEGTWTPVISDGTNDATSNIAVGTYTKVGNLVHVQGRIVLSSLGSVSGAVQLKGLPFNSKALSNNFGVMVVGRASLLNRPAGLKVSGDLRSNVDYVNLILNDTNSGTSNMQSTEFTDDGDIAFSMQYITA